MKEKQKSHRNDVIIADFDCSFVTLNLTLSSNPFPPRYTHLYSSSHLHFLLRAPLFVNCIFHYGMIKKSFIHLHHILNTIITDAKHFQIAFTSPKYASLRHITCSSICTRLTQPIWKHRNTAATNYQAQLNTTTRNKKRTIRK